MRLWSSADGRSPPTAAVDSVFRFLITIDYYFTIIDLITIKIIMTVDHHRPQPLIRYSEQSVTSSDLIAVIVIVIVNIAIIWT